jgi:hypothetical protein
VKRLLNRKRSWAVFIHPALDILSQPMVLCVRQANSSVWHALCLENSMLQGGIMNILSRNTRILLLATALCLHFLAAPAQGEDRASKKRASFPGQTMAQANFQTDGERRPGVRAQNESRERRGSFNDKHAAPGRIPTSADLGTITPPAHLLRLDTTPEPRTHDSSVRQKNRDRRDSHVASPRQESAVQKSGFAARDDDRRTDRRYQDRMRDSSYRNYRPTSDHRRPSSQLRHDRNHRPVVKHVVHTIPTRHAVILHGRDRYHYYSGRFYRPWNSGFVLVRPPLGLVVLNIPLGSRIFISAGITYHVFGDVFYRRVPAGYQVVEPIRGYGPYRADRVEVVIDLLNLRYGPETSEAVIAQVERYTTLRVLGSAPGWLYVEVEGEDLRGWVMERYVSVNMARG